MGLIEPLFLSNTLLGASISDPLDDFLNTLGTLRTSPTRWWHQDAPTFSHLRKEETALKKDFTLLLWGEQWVVRKGGNLCMCHWTGKWSWNTKSFWLWIKSRDPNCTFLINSEKEKGKETPKVKWESQLSPSVIRSLQRLELYILWKKWKNVRIRVFINL